ncbi:TIGR03986 family CRISPR-associated RAMP protein [Vibrio navarrensis]|nr:TIGR03986 family CRISPR-associated RAMP protein [Vibrio navarrensis]EJL6565985.1 TIGR03986 family CRISPR-associated RAMP protein [Vibrio navarrensis]
MSSKIHAPYHFVPLSKWVYMPDWAHLVSHDVPFRDGISGVIEYDLSNQTPLCVGSEQIKQADGSSLVKFARDPMGKLIIPGSSVKGMLRSVLEIAGFGKFNQFDDRRFSFRDISSARGNYLSNIIAKYPPQAGWLKFDVTRQQWFFTPCQYAKVRHAEIRNRFDIEIKNEQPAVEKYRRFPLSYSCNANISLPKGKQNNRWAEQLGNGDTNGQLVFTNKRILSKGQPADYEFSYFFFNPDERKRKWQIDQQVHELFANHNKEQIDYLKQNPHLELGMPVFALVKGEQVHSLGLAKMPRVGYQHSTQQLVEKQNKAHVSPLYFDMAELIFGTLRDKGVGLKSRVSFSDARCVSGDSSVLYQSNLVVLNEPKATFYPAYIEQNQNDTARYNDYDNAQPISGYKRYISKEPLNSKLESNVVSENRKVAGAMELCPAQNSFRGRIVFHNLKPLELGALLWCIQLESGSCHQLGHGKPMGAGAVTIKPQLAKVNTNQAGCSQTVESLVAQFVSHMEEQHPNQQWRQSPQLEYLLAIGRLQENTDLDTRYMDINKKEFQAAKREFAKLEPLHGLNRKDALAQFSAEKQPSDAFASGRLAVLFDQEDLWQKSVLDAKEKRIETRRLEQIAQNELREKEQMLASMSEHQRYVEELKEELQQTNATEVAPVLRNAMQHMIDIASEQEAFAARELHTLARSYGLHKTPRRRVDEQKKLMAQLLSAYGIEA